MTRTPTVLMVSDTSGLYRRPVTFAINGRRLTRVCRAQSGKSAIVFHFCRSLEGHIQPCQNRVFSVSVGRGPMFQAWRLERQAKR